MKIKVEPLFVGVAAFYCLLERSFLPLLVILSALMHECGHLYAMKKRGYTAKALEAKGFGFRIAGATLVKRYSDDIAVAVAGPLTNFVAAFAIFAFSAVFYRFRHAMFLVAVNLALGAVNLLPVRILDGGRILYAAIASTRGFESAEKASATISAIMSALVVAVGIAVFASNGYNFSLLLIGAYLLASSIRT